MDRETITRFFQPPIGKSTFHDLVAKGRILPVKGLRGFYRLNESLARLGLRPVAELPKEFRRSGEDLARWAFSMLDSQLFPEPSWLLFSDPTEIEEQAAMLMASVHRPYLHGLESIEEKLAYVAGAIDAQCMLDRESALGS